MHYKPKSLRRGTYVRFKSEKSKNPIYIKVDKELIYAKDCIDLCTTPPSKVNGRKVVVI
jgi:hypothetical protein